MIKWRRRRQIKRFTFTVLVVIIILALLLTRNGKKLRGNGIPDGVTVSVITSHRENAYYLNDVVSAFKDNNVVIYNTAQYHPSLMQSTFGRNVLVENVWTGQEYDIVPHKGLKTDVHKTRRYRNVNVVKTEKRKHWWQKQNLDFLKVARKLRAVHRSPFYLILEDDNVYNSEMPIVDTLASVKGAGPIVHMGVGMGALFISDAMLESFIGYMALRADILPVDWMVEMFIDSLGLKITHRPSFKHVGAVSTKPDQVAGKY